MNSKTGCTQREFYFGEYEIRITKVTIDFGCRYADAMAGTRQDLRLALQRLAFSQSCYFNAA